MTNFEKVIGDLIEVEGGYVNHKADKGGPTNWGITINTLTAWRKKVVFAIDVKNLTKDEAMQIYKTNYWDKVWLDKVPSTLICRMLFDQAVHRGPSTAIKNFQRAANATGVAALSVDGKMNDKTLKSMQTINPIWLGFEYIKAIQDDYATIIMGNPTQVVFLAGWINRSQFLMDHLFDEIGHQMELKFDTPEGLLQKIAQMIKSFLGKA